MWSEKVLKIIPALLFLFLILEIFELVLIINGMNKIEKLEAQLKENLETTKTIANILSEHLNGMEHFQDKKKHK
ncbi:hypothetical protein [Helicobacter pylori]|uniref:Uncharacterized protein n=1 Tax=Helicobacter pylori TaxID=210 RepID=A0AB73QRG0_HELPX|nr:hypothetical protein [Helicobacter pylori]PDW29295.1 hypothetical protein BB451_02885 [Helicobacter pylori]